MAQGAPKFATSRPLQSAVGRPPTTGDMLGQRFMFKPAWWHDRIQQPKWTSFLDSLPEVDDKPDRRWIDRRTLLTTSRAEPCRALVAAYVWGTGDQAFVVPRRARMFAANDSEVIEDRLGQVRAILDNDGDDAVAEAYRALSRHGTAWLRYLGPSFFTKVLYALDAHGEAPGRALILDQFVIIALNDLCGTALPERASWNTPTYLAWLSFAREQAQRLSDDLGAEVRPDAVEFMLFQQGKNVTARRKSGRR